MNESFDHIDDLLVKYLLHEASESERKTVENWINQDPGHASYFQQFRRVWEESRNLAAATTADEDAAWKRFHARLHAHSPAAKKMAFAWWRVAAAFIFIVGAAIIAYLAYNREETIQTLTAHAENSVVSETLPDGSNITLNKNSSLIYPSKFKGHARAVNLKGEAFFNIHPDRSHPFLIYVNALTIRVVGTSFNVRSRNGVTEVIVATGTVQVMKGRQVVELKPKEKLLAHENDSLFVKNPEKEKLYNYYLTREFVCDNTPLWKLTDVLNEAYGVHITIEKKQSRNLLLTTTFSNESLDHILEVVCLTFGLKQSRSGNNIILE
ncbi:MAG TPA: FecR family protein [Flavisolibacter sp.]|nr:FecR family protein [Flavisolibacter sp.]